MVKPFKGWQRQKQEDFYGLKVSLGYIAGSRPAWAT